MESMLLAIATFLASPAGQNPNREPMWFDGCAKIVEVQTKSDEWIYFCGDDLTQEDTETVEETTEEWVEEPNEEVEQFSFKKQTKALPKKQKASTVKTSTVKATKAGAKTKRTNASKLPKSNSKAKPRISFY
jgi:hypothetical protein